MEILNTRTLNRPFRIYPPILIQATQRRQHEGHNTPLGSFSDQGPYKATVSMAAKGSIVV